MYRKISLKTHKHFEIAKEPRQSHHTISLKVEVLAKTLLPPRQMFLLPLAQSGRENSIAINFALRQCIVHVPSQHESNISQYASSRHRTMYVAHTPREVSYIIQSLQNVFLCSQGGAGGGYSIGEKYAISCMAVVV